MSNANYPWCVSSSLIATSWGIRNAVAAFLYSLVIVMMHVATAVVCFIDFYVDSWLMNT